MDYADKRANSLGRRSGAGFQEVPRRVRAIRAIRRRELCPFTIRLATMLDAGLPLVQCLEALHEQCEHAEFQRVIREVGQRIEAGDSLAEALTYYRELFGELYISMIRSGEAGGGLAEVTARLGAYLESSAALRRRLISAMTYPVMVMVLSILLTAGMILFIVPKFADIYADFDATLPAATRLLVAASAFMRRHFLVALAGTAAAIYLVRFMMRTEQGRKLWDEYVLKVPVFGKLVGKVALARMARTFASLVRSGVPILRTFEIAAQATGNAFYAGALEGAGREVEAGAAVVKSLKSRAIFPPMVIHMVGAGEKTGSIDTMLEKVADFYEDEVTAMLESLSSMIEPLLMVFLGVVVGGIVICMFLPIFKLSEIINV